MLWFGKDGVATSPEINVPLASAAASSEFPGLKATELTPLLSGSGRALGRGMRAVAHHVLRDLHHGGLGIPAQRLVQRPVIVALTMAPAARPAPHWAALGTG
jgi:hypothetical protein